MLQPYALIICAVFMALVPSQSNAQTSSAQPPQTYVGSAICEDGDLGIRLTVNDAGPMMPEEFDDPCRSGTGHCNESYARSFRNTRHVEGEIDFFPLANPSSVMKSSYKVQGTVLRWGPHKDAPLVWEGFVTMTPQSLSTLFLTYHLVIDPSRASDTRLMSNTNFRLSIVTNLETGQRETSVNWNRLTCGTVDLAALIAD